MIKVMQNLNLKVFVWNRANKDFDYLLYYSNTSAY